MAIILYIVRKPAGNQSSNSGIYEVTTYFATGGSLGNPIGLPPSSRRATSFLAHDGRSLSEDIRSDETR